MIQPTSTALVRIVLVDDHEHIYTLVNTLLKATSDLRLVGHAFRGEDATSLCTNLQPDLVLMDVALPGMNGADATKAVLKAAPTTKVLILSSLRDYEHIKDALDSGAIGYLVKDAITEDLVTTIRTTMHGNTVLSPEVAQIVLNPPATPSDFGLTERERQVLRLLAAGQTNAEIALNLNISQPTVRFHLTNILGKFEVDTRSEALVVAAKNNLI